MRRVIKGRLANVPEVRIVNGKNGEFKVVDFTLYEADPTSAVKSEDGKEHWLQITRRCRAYGELANEIATLTTKDLVTAVATMKINEFQPKDKNGNPAVKEDGSPQLRRSEYLLFEKLDKENTIDVQLNTLLNAYVKGGVDKLDAGIDSTFPKVEDKSEKVEEMDKEVPFDYDDTLDMDM